MSHIMKNCNRKKVYYYGIVIIQIGRCSSSPLSVTKSFAQQVNRGKVMTSLWKMFQLAEKCANGHTGFAVTFRATMIVGTDVRWLQVETCSAALLNLLTHQRCLFKVKNGSKIVLRKWWSSCLNLNLGSWFRLTKCPLLPSHPGI